MSRLNTRPAAAPSGTMIERDRRLASRTRLRDRAGTTADGMCVDRDQLEVQKRCETLRVLGAGAVAEIPDHGQAGGGDPVAIERLLQKVPIRFNLGRSIRLGAGISRAVA